jgi:hypothetical protein
MAGPENEEDLRFEYAVETGRIPIPKGPFYNPLEWAVNEMEGMGEGAPTTIDGFMGNVSKLNKKAYEYGMFNPVKPRTAEQSGMPANSFNPQDIVGAPQLRSYGFAGQYVPTNYNWYSGYGGENLLGNRSAVANGELDTRRMANIQNGGYVAEYRDSGKTINPDNTYNAKDQGYRATPATYQFPNKRLWNWTA